MRKKALSFILFLGTLAGLVCAGQDVSLAESLPFSDFSRKVLEYYPQLKAAYIDVDAALARQMQARAGFWPSLDLSLGYKVTDDPVNVFGVLLRQERFTSADFDLKRMNTPSRHQDFSAGLQARWPLFDAMQTIGRARSAREHVKAAEADAAFTKMEALLIAQDAYQNALTLERLLSLVKKAVSSSQKDLEQAGSLKEKGMILGADYYAARVILGDMTRIKNELVRQKKAMDALLSILMGEPLGRNWKLSPIVRARDADVPEINDLLLRAYSGRPDVTGLQRRWEAANADLARARSSILPRVNAFGEAAHDRNKINTDGGNNYTVGVTADMSVFDPSREGRIREARAHKARIGHDIQILKDMILRDIVQEMSRLGSLQDNMTVLKDMGKDAREAVSSMMPLYREGRKSVRDLLSARLVCLQVEEAYEKARAGIWMSEARLLFLSGRLGEESVQVPAERSGL